MYANTVGRTWPIDHTVCSICIKKSGFVWLYNAVTLIHFFMPAYTYLKNCDYTTALFDTNKIVLNHVGKKCVVKNYMATPPKTKWKSYCMCQMEFVLLAYLFFLIVFFFFIYRRFFRTTIGGYDEEIRSTSQSDVILPLDTDGDGSILHFDLSTSGLDAVPEMSNSERDELEPKESGQENLHSLINS